MQAYCVRFKIILQKPLSSACLWPHWPNIRGIINCTKKFLRIFKFINLYFSVHSYVRYIFYTEVFPAVVIHARHQYTKQYITQFTLIPDDGPIRPETSRIWWFL